MELQQNLSALLAIAAAAALTWVVLSPRVNEGLVIKSGLILLIVGLLAQAGQVLSGIETWRGAANAAVLQHGGLCVALVGYALRVRVGRRRARRAVDRRLLR